MSGRLPAVQPRHPEPLADRPVVGLEPLGRQHLFTSRYTRAHRARQSSTGQGRDRNADTGLLSDEMAPFGGVKQSGVGREGSLVPTSEIASPVKRKMATRIGNFENCGVHEERTECSSSSGDHSCDITPSQAHSCWRWPRPLAWEEARPPVSRPLSRRRYSSSPIPSFRRPPTQASGSYNHGRDFAADIRLVPSPRRRDAAGPLAAPVRRP
jgi:hypothetical protein